MRRQLRPFWDDNKIAEIYAKAFDHTLWPAHQERIENTIAEACQRIHNSPMPVSDVADLTAGDGVISGRIAAAFDAELILGDITDTYDIVGPIELTIETLPHVDLLIMTETIEHLKDPDYVLAKAILHSDMVLISTPLSEFDDRNEEHYWGWDHDGVRDILVGAGWSIMEQWDFTPESNGYYTFQNWIAI